MRPFSVRPELLAALVAAAFLLPSAEAASARQFDVLVFSETTGFRHDSIPAGIAAIRELGAKREFRVRATEDAASFTRRKLKRFEAVVFLNTTGTVLNARQKRAFESYMRSGGGFVGIHSAADTEYSWPFYERLVGAYFLTHPAPQTAAIVNEAVDHPATAHLRRRFTIFDELYSFRTNPRKRVRVLLSIDEGTYDPGPTGRMGDHPMSWCRGRAFYTALGHTSEQYARSWFRRHLLGGIRTAAGRVRADCSP